MILLMRPLRLGLALLVVASSLSLPAAAQQRPFEQVVAELKSPDAGTRLSALKALGESGYTEAAGPIAPLLSDPEPRIRREALDTELGLFLGAQAAKKRGTFVFGRRDPSAAFRAFDGNWASMPAARVPMEVVSGLLTALDDRNAAVREEAAYAIGVLGQIEGTPPDAAYKAVLEALADRLWDPEPAVRTAVARASGRVFRRCPDGCGLLALDRIGDGLMRLLDDPEVAVQGAALEGLGEIRYERAVTRLTELFGRHKNGELAFAALDTLARIGHASSVPLFRTAISSGDPNFRRAAVEGLGRSGDKDAAAALDAMTSTERDGSVILALVFAQHRSARARQVNALIQALGNRDVRGQAQQYLVELGTAVAPDLAAALPSAPPDARIALLEALGVNGCAAQAPAIEPLQNDSDRRVAVAAQRALSRIRSLAQ